MNDHVKICVLLLDKSSFSITRDCLGDVSDRLKNPLLFLEHLWKTLSKPSRPSLWLDKQRAQLVFKAYFWTLYWNHFQSTHIDLACQTLQTRHKGTGNQHPPIPTLTSSCLKTDKLLGPDQALRQGLFAHHGTGERQRQLPTPPAVSLKFLLAAVKISFLCLLNA